MIKKFFEGSERKLIAIYVVTTAIIYGAFWVGYYFLSFGAAIGFSVGIVALGGLCFCLGRKSFWAPFAFGILVSFAMGLCISSFFVATGIVPSRFLGLVLIIMLAWKIVQAIFARVLINGGHGGVSKIFLTVCTVVEVIVCIVFGVIAVDNAPLYWQIFFALLICVFYSCGQFTLKKSSAQDFWRKAAISYLLGFVFLFVVVVLLAISILAEDGSPLEALFGGSAEFGAELGAEGIGARRKKKI